ncbi:MAG: 3-methyl-2-oxobutanoate hydroxymethyltransferase [Omnitrophica bacterium RIFCSPLOWO2_02_FULL_45_16]|nr:MAG: 3-methyl-2-oxobutanoate hydroxymethyltransferase [Omnitrophica bacterium RIFCSPLOWO2_12_FULL_45_13]OGX01497.1 MAG: 3-methyl-2-oxobutanoate hydroxymethyltransferase [Omnitrophica bacterium RIFCSPLOWO2_02_FULL_45_16]
MERKKITITDIQNKKREGRKITMLTAYDYPMARLVDEAGIDVILVGDSLGMVVLGYESTVPVTMDEMIHHSKAVRRGTKYAFLVGDMPFMSYQVSKEEAVRNAGRFMKEAGCDAVKLEGGDEVLDVTRAIIDAGIPVLGHLGLTPQTISKLGGYKIQGKDAKAAKRILEQALKLKDAGCFAIVLECVPDKVAKLITEKLMIPTIGIGAGPYCDGQVLVTNDMVGLFDRFVPKFVKQYVKLSTLISDGLKKYRDEVEKGIFPDQAHSFAIKEEEIRKLKKR